MECPLVVDRGWSLVREMLEMNGQLLMLGVGRIQQSRSTVLFALNINT